MRNIGLKYYVILNISKENSNQKFQVKLKYLMQYLM